MNDNEIFTFKPLAHWNALAVKRLELTEEKQEDAQRNTERDRKDKEDAEERRRYIEQRLRDTAAFERRARGLGLRKNTS